MKILREAGRNRSPKKKEEVWNWDKEKESEKSYIDLQSSLVEVKPQTGTFNPLDF